MAFIDDDAHPKPRWLAEATRHFADGNVVGVGSPGITPPGDDAGQRAKAAPYHSSPLVSGGYTYRYLPARSRDMVGGDLPSCGQSPRVRRGPFLDFVPQCIRYWPGRGHETLHTAHGPNGARIVYNPDVAVFHHRRRCFRAHMKQSVELRGASRGFSQSAIPKRRGVRHISSECVRTSRTQRSLAAALARSPPRKPHRAASRYLLLCGWGRGAAQHQRALRANPAMVAAGIYATHLTYGIGFLAGLVLPELDH